MTDTPPVPPTPETPATPVAAPAAATPPAAPAPAGAYVPGPAVKQTQSLVSFIIGIVAFLFAAVPFVNFLAFAGGIVAVVLGFRAKKAEPDAPKWMSLVGIIGGFVAIGLSLIFGLIYLITFLAPLLFLGACGNSVC